MNVLISRIDIGSNGWLEPKSFSGWRLPPFCWGVDFVLQSPMPRARRRNLSVSWRWDVPANKYTSDAQKPGFCFANSAADARHFILQVLDSIFSLNPVVHHSCIANEHTQTLEQPTACLRRCSERPPVWRGYWAERFGGEGQGPLQSTSCAWKPTSTQEDFRFLGIFSDFFFETTSF